MLLTNRKNNKTTAKTKPTKPPRSQEFLEQFLNFLGFKFVFLPLSDYAAGAVAAAKLAAFHLNLTGDRREDSASQWCDNRGSIIQYYQCKRSLVAQSLSLLYEAFGIVNAAILNSVNVFVNNYERQISEEKNGGNLSNIKSNSNSNSNNARLIRELLKKLSCEINVTYMENNKIISVSEEEGER